MMTPYAPSPQPRPISGLDTDRIQAITLDLDDTLWPIWPAIARADEVLRAWLAERAPATAALCAQPDALRAARAELERQRPELAHDLSAMRREAIRGLLQRAGDDPALAEPAFEVFFAERQRVDLYADALPALERLSARYPLVTLTNGNADVHRVGIGGYFRGEVTARRFGVGKPDPRIFQAAADAAGVPASAVLHVGDDPALDGVGALNAGMQLAWVNRAGHAWSHGPVPPHATVSDLLALCDLLGL